MKRLKVLGTIALASLAGCQSAPPPAAVSTTKSAALRNMEPVAISAYRCWFSSKDPAFRDYRMANELNSFSGTPRFLLVPAKHYEGRPLLVVQASGPAGRMDVFGPLMDGPLGKRIGADVARWRGGNTSCSATA